MEQEKLFIHSGFFKHAVEIESPARVADGGGGYSTAWQLYTSCWAAMEVMGAKDVRFHQREGQQLSHRFYLRYREDITIGMRLRLGERQFLILTVSDPDETKRVIALETVEGAKE